ncbi:MAG: HAD-IIIC family phosphatase [Alphaproteobacteria bacterium]|nr:HAD-IIIC family phosphatase [Alphaproteobacteria bacterium]QQS58083.1 MAG: HAD-IIIC family phosphatase [Alphaproteobacteria bacterium]
MNDLAKILATWRTYSRTLKENPETSCDIRIGIAGSFTVDNLIPHFGGWLLQKGFTAPEIVAGPYNQLHQLCIDHKTVLDRDHDFDALILLWRLEDILPEALEGALQQDEKSFERMAQEIRQLAQSIKKLRSTFAGTVIISTPPYPSLNAFDLQELGQYEKGRAVYNHLLEIWNNELDSIEGIKIFDLAGLLTVAGLNPAHDPRKWYLYRQPYTEQFSLQIGKVLARILASGKISAKKCIVLDADNTMWGGVIGEDGLGGIEIGNDFPGLAFRDFQKQMLHFQKQGIMLAIASKNNEEDVLEVLDKHDAMVLRREHFSAMEINWVSKVEGIKNIAKRLNIGTDALVFVDDNKKEIGEVQERLPEVTCFLVPEELAEFPGLLKNTGLFDLGEVTKEDRERTKMMAQESIRKQASEQVSEEEFRAALGLKVKVFEVDSQHLARTTQLINKTNQFNVTTIRRSQDEVKALCDSPDAIVLATEIEDRYGEYGLVGVAILKKSEDPKIWDIDTLLMSCRVLGRGADTAFLAQVIEAARQKGAQTVRGKYIPTQKNKMVEDLYKRHGFTSGAEEGEWTIEQKQKIDVPDYIATMLTTLKSNC